MVTPGSKHPSNVIYMPIRKKRCSCCPYRTTEFCSVVSHCIDRSREVPASAPVQPVAVEDKKESKDSQDDESVDEEDMIIVEKSNDKENVPTVRPTLNRKDRKKSKQEETEQMQEFAAESVLKMQSLPNPSSATESSNIADFPVITSSADSTAKKSTVQDPTGMKSAQVITGVLIAALVVVSAAYYLIKNFSNSFAKERKSRPVEKTLV